MDTYISAIKKHNIARQKAKIARVLKAYESVIND